MNTTRNLTLLLVPFLLSSLAACVDQDLEDPAPNAEDTALQTHTDELQYATATTAFDPVVKIKGTWTSGNTKYSKYCTATAIADDMLLTAAHCLYRDSGDKILDSVKVVDAHGDNSSSDSKQSMFYVIPESYNDDAVYGSYNDLALVKFGAGTFDAYYEIEETSSSRTGETVTILGYGGTYTKKYGDDTVIGYATDGDFARIYTHNSNQDTDLENGDSGGPVLSQQSDGSYKIIGVNSGTSDYITWEQGRLTVLSSKAVDVIESAQDAFAENCVEIFKNSDFSGESWSWCLSEEYLEGQINTVGFQEDWEVIQKESHFSEWNNKITSLTIPEHMSLRVFKSTGQDGGRRTFQTMFDFGDAYAIDNLNDYGINDDISSWALTKDTTPSSQIFHIEIDRHDKCLDVANSGTSNGTNIQQRSCSENDSDQKFKMVHVSGAYYQIKHVASGKCLDVSGGSSANGTNIQLWSCSSSNQNQLFDPYSITTTDDQRVFMLKNKKTSKCVDLSGGSSSNGANIQIWSCGSSNQNQRFRLKQFE